MLLRCNSGVSFLIGYLNESKLFELGRLGGGREIRPWNTHENSWNTIVHHSSSVASQQSWPSRLPPDLGEAAGACVPQPDSWRRPAEVTPDRRVGTFPAGGHRWSGQAVASTSSSSSLRTSTRWTFLNTDFRCAGVLIANRTDAHLTVNHACVYSGHLCFWVTLLNLL